MAKRKSVDLLTYIARSPLSSPRNFGRIVCDRKNGVSDNKVSAICVTTDDDDEKMPFWNPIISLLIRLSLTHFLCGFFSTNNLYQKTEKDKLQQLFELIPYNKKKQTLIKLFLRKIKQFFKIINTHIRGYKETDSDWRPGQTK